VSGERPAGDDRRLAATRRRPASGTFALLVAALPRDATTPPNPRGAWPSSIAAPSRHPYSAGERAIVHCSIGARQRGADGMSGAEELHGLFFEDLKVGQTSVVARTITEADIVLFAGLSGDTNPVHINEEFAAGTMFSGRIAHGMLTAAFISTVIGTRLPGPGAIYLSQTLRFKAPVRVGDTIWARATVTELFPEKRRAALSTTVTVRDKVVLEGEALVMVPRRAAAATPPAKAAAAE
jgi:3-hydroxybutyryl-CoA dehydratase